MEPERGPRRVGGEGSERGWNENIHPGCHQEEEGQHFLEERNLREDAQDLTGASDKTPSEGMTETCRLWGEKVVP